MLYARSPVSYTHLDVYKRQGHGGVMDRFDSALFVLGALYAIIIIYSRIKSVSYTHLDVYKRQLL